MRHGTLLLLLLVPSLAACSKTGGDGEIPLPENPPAVPLDGVARLLSSLPIGPSQMNEVADAVNSSSGNGYDEEYTMQQLFDSPGAGVGDEVSSKAPGSYETPLRDMIRAAVRSSTKAGGENYGDPEEYLAALSSSDLQIYWPYSGQWDGKTAPVISFDPGDGRDVNTGYVLGADGAVQELLVDEQMARSRPVWVVNRNSDAGYTSLEMLRRQDPSWGSGGGEIVVRPMGTSSPEVKTLLAKTLVVNRQLDSWFCGGAEMVFRMGSVEDFTASTEAELKLYSPSVTHFMVVVQRSQVGIAQPLNAVLVSEWTKGLDRCAFMLVEEDGGTQTKWKCSAVVKWNSKSYGYDMDIPLNVRDDIVWRGQLTRNYFEKNSGKYTSFGDVGVVFEFT